MEHREAEGFESAHEFQEEGERKAEEIG